MTIPETLLLAVLARLADTTTAALLPPNSSGVAQIRRLHRVDVPRDDAPQCHLVDGTDAPRTGANTSNRTQCLPRQVDCTVSLFIRAEATYSAADPLVEEVFRRLDPLTAPYAYGTAGASARLTVLEVKKDPEPADGNALRLDIGFRFSYDVNGFGLSA
jgi:hypothetical protein